MTSRTTNSVRVAADVGELLGPHVRIDVHSDDSISGNRSVMPPGWMPVPCRVTPASRQTASSSATSREANG